LNAQIRVNTFVVSQSNETHFATWRTQYLAERQQQQIRCEDVTETQSALNANASFALNQLKCTVQTLLDRSELEGVQRVEDDECEVGENESRDLVVQEHEDDESVNSHQRADRKRLLTELHEPHLRKRRSCKKETDDSDCDDDRSYSCHHEGCDDSDTDSVSVANGSLARELT
jgi:hypothetical protein